MDDSLAALDLLADGHPLRSAIRGVLAGWSIDRIAAVNADPPGYDKQIWQSLLQVVWPSVASACDVRVVAEEIGVTRCPLPLHSGLVQPAALLAALGERAAPLLAELRAGRVRYAMGFHDDAGEPIVSTPSVTAEPADGGWRLRGSLRHVLLAADADVLLVPARIGASGTAMLATVYRESSGVSATTHQAMDGSGLTDLELVDVSVASVHALGVDDAGSGGSRALAAAFAFGIIARCGELTGLAAGLLQRTVARVRERHAFGQPLGALQSVQQRAADMYLDVVAARDATAEAAVSLDAAGSSPAPWAQLDRDLRLSLSAAHVTATQAAIRVAAAAHQLCGGWGQLAAAGLHHYTRAIKTAEGQLGSVRYHRALIAAELARG